jgi:hypothetical protein
MLRCRSAAVSKNSQMFQKRSWPGNLPCQLGLKRDLKLMFVSPLFEVNRLDPFRQKVSSLCFFYSRR